MKSSMGLSDWSQRALSQTFDPRGVVGGARVEAAGGSLVDAVNPSTGAVLYQLPAGTAADVDRAVAVAQGVFGQWSAVAGSERARILMRFADLLDSHAEELGLLDTLEMGMPIAGSVADAAVASGLVRWCAQAAGKSPDELLPGSGPGIRMNVRVPRGVVAAITPWNFPTFNVVSKLAPALATGNVVVVKPSEIAGLSALLIAELLLEAGLPEGVANVVPGLGTTVGEALAAHPLVDFVSFTGSTRVGRRLMGLSAASNLKPLALELGGKSPQLVFASAPDLDVVADAVCAAVFWNSGQVCTAGSRLIVEEGAREALLARVEERAAAISIGDPLDLATTHGPLASEVQRDRVQQIVGDACDAGARVLTGGARAVALPDGFGFEPTVIEAAPGDSTLSQEIFGPVLSVQSFSDTDEAIALANDTEYGLAAYVWSGEPSSAYSVARAIRCGSVAINPSADDPTEPAGAVIEPARSSGFGPEGGIAGMHAYTRWQSISINF